MSVHVVEESQFVDLQVFLKDHSRQDIVILVLSVPTVYLSKIVAEVTAEVTASDEDFSHRWSSGGDIRDRDKLFRTLAWHQQNQPNQKLVLVSGDIHIGCAQRIQWTFVEAPPFSQLVPSGITNSLGTIFQFAVKNC